MAGLFWTTLFVLGVLVAALLIALVFAIVRYVRRRALRRALSSHEGSANDIWPPPPTGGVSHAAVLSAHMALQQPAKTRSPYLVPILAMWSIFLVGTSFEFAGVDTVAFVCRIVYGALGLYLVIRDDVAAKVNGGLVLFIIVRHIVRSV